MHTPTAQPITVGGKNEEPGKTGGTGSYGRSLEQHLHTHICE